MIVQYVRYGSVHQQSAPVSLKTMPASHHRLSIICVNDVYSFDDADNNGNIRGGWARATSLIKSLKRRRISEPDSTVLVTANGDLLGGSSLLQHSKGTAAVEVMNSIPIDVACLGNHEFDYGDEPLMQRIEESNYKWLGSNVYYSNESGSQSYFPGVDGDGLIYNLRDRLKLGVFGLCTKQTPKISYPSLKVKFDEDFISVARRTCNILRAKGAHVIVAITHMSEAEDLSLARDKETGVDLIVGGHEHEPLSVMIHRGQDSDNQEEKHNLGGVLVFKCGMNCDWVGTVDLDISFDSADDDQHTRVNSISTSYAMHAVSSNVPEDAGVIQIVKRHRERTEKDMLVSCFGQDTAAKLHLDDIIATIDKSSKSLPLDTRMSSVRRREATGGNLIADAMHWMLKTHIQSEYTNLPMLAMINGGFIRADRLYQPGSDFTVRHLLKELPFPRGMVVLKLNGKHLKEALAQQLKGSSRGPTGAFPHLSQNSRMVYERSSSKQDVEIITIHSLTVDGSDVADDQEYLIAVTGFVADGSEGCTSWLHSIRIGNIAWKDKRVCYIVLKYLQHNPVIIPRLEARTKCEPNC